MLTIDHFKARRERSPHRVHHLTAACALALLAAGNASAAPTFTVVFDASASGLTTTERNDITSHLQAAGRAWSQALAIRTSPSIDLSVSIAAVPTANAGSTTSVFVGVIGGRDAYEMGVASELRTGVDPNGATPDANITIGLDYLRNELWFDPAPATRTAPVPVNRTDAMSVALHEIGHTLAYSGWANLTTGAPAQNYWSLWDTYIVPGSVPVFDGYFATLARAGVAPELTVGNINHWGRLPNGLHAATEEHCLPPETAWRDGAPVPVACEVPGSADAPHAASVGSLIDELMNGVVFYRGRRYDISTLDHGVMRDIGLSNDAVMDDSFEPRI
jgi:hypothetical protein